MKKRLVMKKWFDNTMTTIAILSLILMVCCADSECLLISVVSCLVFSLSSLLLLKYSKKDLK